MAWYAITDLAEITGTTESVIREAAVVCGKREMAGMLTWRTGPPLDFILEIHRVHAARLREAQRRGHDSSHGHRERAVAA